MPGIQSRIVAAVLLSLAFGCNKPANTAPTTADSSMKMPKNRQGGVAPPPKPLPP